MYHDVEFVLFCGKVEEWDLPRDRVTLRGGFAANDRMVARLIAEHFQIGPAAKRAGCDILITTGLVPVVANLPVAMQLFTLHHLSSANRTGGLRSAYRNWATYHGLRKAALIITNTRFACDQILPVASAAASKLLQSYEGIDHARFHPHRTNAERTLLRERFGITGAYFFWCSNFYPYKQAEPSTTSCCIATPRCI